MIILNALFAVLTMTLPTFAADVQPLRELRIDIHAGRKSQKMYVMATEMNSKFKLYQFPISTAFEFEMDVIIFNKLPVPASCESTRRPVPRDEEFYSLARNSYRINNIVDENAFYERYNSYASYGIIFGRNNVIVSTENECEEARLGKRATNHQILVGKADMALLMDLIKRTERRQVQINILDETIF